MKTYGKWIEGPRWEFSRTVSSRVFGFLRETTEWFVVPKTLRTLEGTARITRQLNAERDPEVKLDEKTSYYDYRFSTEALEAELKRRKEAENGIGCIAVGTGVNLGHSTISPYHYTVTHLKGGKKPKPPKTVKRKKR